MHLWEAVWPWTVALLLLPAVILPIFAVACEKTEIRLTRATFALWILGIGAVHLLVGLVGRILDRPGLAVLAAIVMWTAVAFPLYTRFVRRARDAGLGKTIAFLSIVPLINILTTAILMLRPSMRRPDVSRLFD